MAAEVAARTTHGTEAVAAVGGAPTPNVHDGGGDGDDGPHQASGRI